MWIKHKKIISLGKVLLLLVILLLSGTVAWGCYGIRDKPEGGSGGVISNGTLFLGSIEGSLVAIDLSNHARLFPDVPLEDSRPSSGGFGCATTASTTVAIYGNPAVSGDLVYVGGYNGKIYAINSSSGVIKWEYPSGSSRLQPIVGGPIVALGKVYFGCSDGKVYALAADTGLWQWDFQTGDAIWPTPVFDGGTLYIGSFDKKLYALDAFTGEEKWEEPFETQGAIASTPLVYNNTIYVGSFDRRLYAVDITDGSEKWSSFEGGKWFWAKPVAYNNAIYAANLDGKVYVLDSESGDKLAEFDLKSPISSSPVLVDDLVIIASEEGKVYSLDTSNNLNPKELKILEEKIYAPLCASNGVVYIHAQTSEQDTLYALNTQTGVTLWSLLLSSK